MLKTIFTNLISWPGKHIKIAGTKQYDFILNKNFISHKNQEIDICISTLKPV